MSFKCKLGIHTWNFGCTCSECGKVREIKHSWNYGCKCTRCGKIRDTAHRWDECICRECGRNRVEFEKQNNTGDDKDYHNWEDDCEKCSKCGITRIKPHDLKYDCEKCDNCNKIFPNNHEWDGCVCKKCKKERHDVGRICSKCGKELTKGTFVDDRDGHTYRWILIGNQILMDEGLKYKTDHGCWAFMDNEKWRYSDGYMYDWETANKVAPLGWHLPTKEEWESLCKIFGDEEETIYRNLKKAFIYFDSAGRRDKRGEYFDNSGRFWSSTKNEKGQVYTFFVSERGSRAGIYLEESDYAFDIRLFKDM